MIADSRLARQVYSVVKMITPPISVVSVLYSGELFRLPSS